MVDLKFDLDRVENYGWMTLEEGEEIEFRTHPSIIPKIPEIAFALLLSLAGIASIFYFPEFYQEDSIRYLIPLTVVFLGVGDALWTYAKVKATFYVFTTDKFIRKFNIFRHTTRETPYDKVQHFDMNYETIPERILNIGTIAIATAGTGGTELVLTDVPNPSRATEVLSEYT